MVATSAWRLKWCTGLGFGFAGSCIVCFCSAEVAVEIRLGARSLQVTSFSTGVTCAVCEAIFPCPAREVVVGGLVSIAATRFLRVALIVTSVVV